MSNFVPSVGRIVHFVTADGATHAAIITKIVDANAGAVCLAVFNTDSVHFNHNASFSQDPEPGYWSWPPKV